MRIVITEFVTVDGVSQGPGSALEDPSDHFDGGGWLVPHMDEAFIDHASGWLDLADGLLLGRRTYEAFARDWPNIPEPDPFTVRMNALPKYVVSTTLAHGNWKPVTMLSEDPIAAVAALRDRPGRELQIHGSGRLAASLLNAGLVDTLRLAVAPTVIGTGRRLLAHPGSAVGLRLTAHSVTPAGVLLLEYATTGKAPVADYAGVDALAQA